MFRIIPFEPSYRDDMFFCLLTAKNHLGRIPKINEDLFDIQHFYFDNADMFWIALNSQNRVIGMCGTQTVSDSDMWLKRLFIMPSLKRNGIASQLLLLAENFARSKQISTIHTRFANDFIEAPLFYSSKGFIESDFSDNLHYFIKFLS